MRRLTDKQLAPVLGLSSPQKVSQSLVPALHKIALIILAYPIEGQQLIWDVVAELKADREAAMPRDELEERVARLEGRANR